MLQEEAFFQVINNNTAQSICNDKVALADTGVSYQGETIPSVTYNIEKENQHITILIPKKDNLNNKDAAHARQRIEWGLEALGFTTSFHNL